MTVAAAAIARVPILRLGICLPKAETALVGYTLQQHRCESPHGERQRRSGQEWARELNAAAGGEPSSSSYWIVGKGKWRVNNPGLLRTLCSAYREYKVNSCKHRQSNGCMSRLSEFS